LFEDVSGRQAAKVEMTKQLAPQCHAELVSAPQLLSKHHAGHLSCGVLKQVQDDFLFYYLSWVGTKQSAIYWANLQGRKISTDLI
jgi:hypothetical protein